MADVYGTSGNDSEDLTTGDDRLFISAGQDYFDGLAGYDIMDMSTATGPAMALLDNAVFFGINHAGGQTIGNNFEEIRGTDGNDFLSFSLFQSNWAEDMTIHGLGGNDRLRGGQGNDILYGGADDDILVGGFGVDEFHGGTGIDEVRLLHERYGNFEDERPDAQSVVVDLRTQTILNDGWGNVEVMSGIENLSAGSVYGDTYDGNANDNFLIGVSFGNDFRARAGDDHVFSFGGGDYDGGLGFDKFTQQAWVSKAPDGADADGLWDDVTADQTVELDLSTGTIINDGYGNSGTATNFEEIEIFTVDLAGIITGSDGNDLVSFTGNGLTMNAGAGVDNITGSVGMDTLNGEADADQLFGMDGNDTIAGGGDNDTIWGGAGEDTLNGNQGNDFINGGTEKDKLFGNAGDDELRGSAGDDTLSGNSGADALYGGGGRDILLVDGDDTVIDGGAGYDRVIVTAPTQSLSLDLAATNIEQVWGNDTAENFDGSGVATSVKIFGGDGGDTILGGSAGDRLYGELGNDVLTGNGGNDRFFFGSGWGDDTVTDYTIGNDRLDVVDAGITQLADMTITNDSGDALISFGGNSIRLTGVDHTLISDADFIYAPLQAQADISETSFDMREDFFDVLFEGPAISEFTDANREANLGLLTDPIFEASDFPSEAQDEFAAAASDFTLGPSLLLDNNNSVFEANDLGLWDMF